jgi:hypothetical protein
MSAVIAATRVLGRSRGRGFFLAMAVALNLLVFAGFAPSFYLRTQFGRPALPSTLVFVHGILFSAWMVLLLVQTALIARGAPKLHRQLGIVGAALATAMVIAGSLAQIAQTRRVIAEGPLAPTFAIENMLFTQALLSMAAFAVLVGLAVRLRRRGAAHKRLIMAATIVLCVAAVGRLPGVRGNGAPIITALLVLPLWANDLITRGRPHAATVWSSAAVVALEVTAFSPLPWTHAVRQFIGWVAA